MIRDKAAELMEWIEYHLLLGIQHFYLYDNLSNDKTHQLLKPYLDKRLVTIVRWPYTATRGRHWNTIQRASMNHALKTFGPYNRWMGYFDVDEYFQLNNEKADLVLNGSTTLAQLLDKTYPEHIYSCGVQFEAVQLSCFLTQLDIIQSRYRLSIEKCNVFLDERQRVPPKMFIRAENIPIMVMIHSLPRLKYKQNANYAEFGRFRHYHHGKLGAVEELKANNGKVDRSMERYVHILKQRIVKY
ncbi:unnamed protein product [Didymodactylos carnosus]|uniref:Glycosyltransferase family 92 protein n=1 Tax=Didymodactylos carnosus TaxID=1234261 RepID=A0A815B7M1_9BILA|nr:unnamed protein product [Didymodactylos carnosus]CAF4044684.1 unnamed protein product [Didymodactylos carnosus]